MQAVITGVNRIFSFENLKILLLAVAFCFVFQSTAAAQEEVIWMQGMGASAAGSFSVADFGPAQKAGSAQFTTDSALADDININGTISRVDVRGYTSGFFAPTSSSTYYYGLMVKFYAIGADNKPGALQAEYFVAKDSPNFIFQNAGLLDLRVRLVPAFQATGRHFLSVQVVMDPVALPGNGGAGVEWYWRSDNDDPVRDEGFYYRSNPGAPWGRDADNDGSRNLSMRLWGTRVLVSPPAISAISKDNLPQAGRLKIAGSNFGNTQGTGTVRINGAVAPVSTWKEDTITAYVSDASTIGAGSVEVITAGGTSNSKPFTVRARPSANGRVLWRFQADDSYIIGRPAIGTDGTIYAAGVGGHLYALTPSGGIKWIFRGSFPVMQSVSVGADNTAYFAGGNVVYAINPNGTLKWQIVNPSGGAFAAGPNVGPDGNIYAVTTLGSDNPNQLGAITISPAGQILNNRQGYVEPRSQALFNREIVFGSNQYYFGGLNNVPFNTGGLEVFQLGGTYRFTISAAGGRQPAVAPDGTIYAVRGGNPGTPERLGAFSPTNGNLLREILPTETYLGHPDMGADGTIYITHNLSVISGYTPT
ncbi:MAG: PQQ-binding-like beta-propeller repeat protein, partial [Pyrinomonadaceae bacterium]